jgi:hypothetical protein
MSREFCRSRLSNGRNVGSLDVTLGDRMLVLTPNASDETSVLDAFRLRRDVGAQGREKYTDELELEGTATKPTRIVRQIVKHRNRQVLSRPLDADRNDPSLLEQTHRVHAASEVA